LERDIHQVSEVTVWAFDEAEALDEAIEATDFSDAAIIEESYDDWKKQCIEEIELNG